MALIKSFILKLNAFFEEEEMEKWRKEDPEAWNNYVYQQYLLGTSQ